MWRWVVCAMGVLAGGLAEGATWSWEWGAVGEQRPEVEVSPFLYGKQWGYAIEIDDEQRQAQQG